VSKRGSKPAKNEPGGKDNSLIRISLIFLALVAAINLFIYTLYSLGLLGFFMALNTKIAAYLITLAGIENEVSSNHILIESRVLEVTLECTAIYIIAVFVSLVLAYPTSNINKAKGLLVGIPSIVLANFARLVVVAIVSEKYPAYFDYVHDYLWRIAFIMLTITIWFFWVEKERENESKAPIFN